MKRLPNILIVVISLMMVARITTFAQTQQEQYLSKLKNELKPENVISEYEHHDFSALIIPEEDFIGYIGPNYKRIRIVYTSVVRDENNKGRYIIEGISIVGDNKCNFSGNAEINSIYELKSMQFGVDSLYKNAGFRDQGVMVAEYEFREDPAQSHAGTFEGTMLVNWLVDKDGILRSNHVYSYSDSFRDNQHIGTWRGYASNDPKTCNWGLRRIPFSGDLDFGAGGFSPNPKYDQYGWADY